VESLTPTTLRAARSKNRDALNAEINKLTEEINRELAEFGFTRDEIGELKRDKLV
jgi:hypothetical protein